MTTVPWRSKECKSKHTVFIATKPVECVSVDHLQSMEPGFFGQAKEILTKTHYKNATIFVNHYSKLQFGYLMTSNISLLETIEAKQAFDSPRASKSHLLWMLLYGPYNARQTPQPKIKKYKARLNLHGGKQVFGLNYYETYVPLVTWFSIRLLFVIGIIFGWALGQVDFIMSYPQAPIKCDMYMELPQGIQVSEGDSKNYVLKC
jgi:hypothetical protein